MKCKPREGELRSKWCHIHDAYRGRRKTAPQPEAVRTNPPQPAQRGGRGWRRGLRSVRAPARVRPTTRRRETLGVRGAGRGREEAGPSSGRCPSNGQKVGRRPLPHALLVLRRLSLTSGNPDEAQAYLGVYGKEGAGVTKRACASAQDPAPYIKRGGVVGKGDRIPSMNPGQTRFVSFLL